MKITKIAKNTEPTTVYDFTVKDVHHYMLDNGVVTHNSYVPTKEMAGGSGAKYAADTIVFLSKKKERDSDKEIIGNIITANMVKSRLTRENTRVETRVLYDGGLDRYYGLLDYAVEAGLVKKGTKYEFPDGTKAFEKAILANPEKFFTDEFLKKLDAYMQTQFRYSGIEHVDVTELEEVAE